MWAPQSPSALPMLGRAGAERDPGVRESALGSCEWSGRGEAPVCARGVRCAPGCSYPEGPAVDSPPLEAGPHHLPFPGVLLQLYPRPTRLQPPPPEVPNWKGVPRPLPACRSRRSHLAGWRGAVANSRLPSPGKGGTRRVAGTPPPTSSAGTEPWSPRCALGRRGPTSGPCARYRRGKLKLEADLTLK